MNHRNLTTAALLGALAFPALANERAEPVEAQPNLEIEQHEQDRVILIEVDQPEQVQDGDGPRHVIIARKIIIDENGNRIVMEGGGDNGVVVLRDGQIEGGPAAELNADRIFLELNHPDDVVLPGDRAPAQLVKAAFLGVNAEPLDFDSAKLLGVKRGTGLTVGFVAEDSPAAAAGLKQGDVITRLNDQVLVNAEQLAVLIRTHDAGDDVTLHTLRNGEPIERKAKLVVRELPALGPGGASLTREWRVQRGPAGNPFAPELELQPGLWIGDGWGDVQRDGVGPAPEQVREMVEQLRQQMQQQRLDIDEMMQQMRLQLDLNLEALRGDIHPLPGKPNAQQRMQASMMTNDGEHTIALKVDGDDRHLTVSDRAGKVLYDGAVPDDGQIDGLPEDVQAKVDRMLNHNRIELRVQPAEPPQAPQNPAEPAPREKAEPVT